MHGWVVGGRKTVLPAHMQHEPTAARLRFCGTLVVVVGVVGVAALP